jgi:hypothetical protein
MTDRDNALADLAADVAEAVDGTRIEVSCWVPRACEIGKESRS